MRYLAIACLVIGFAGVAYASVGYVNGTPCKEADGWIKVEITDTEGKPWKAAVTYECDPMQKMTGSSSNGTGGFSARPPKEPCSNPVVKFFINHTFQFSQTYNNVPGC